MQQKKKVKKQKENWNCIRFGANLEYYPSPLHQKSQSLSHYLRTALMDR